MGGTTVHSDPARGRPTPGQRLPAAAFDDGSSDAEILARCRERDARAWDVLVNRYEALIFSAARDAGLTVSDAADVTQTTFVTLLDSLDSVREDDRVASWLMTVAQRQIWRTRRRTEREEVATAAVGPGAARLASSVYDADSLAAWERMAGLVGGLQQLGSPCAELLYLLYLDRERPTYSAVASRLGRSIGSIGPTRARCLAKLRTVLAED